jgi:sugar phosphate isomerase/epimerase
MTISRRELLKSFPAAVAVPLLARSASGPEIHFPTSPRERLAVTSYPFRAYIESPTNGGRDKSKRGMDIKEFGAMVLRRFGVQNINPLADHFASTDAAYLEAFRTDLEKAGSHIVGLGLSGGYFYSPDEAKRTAGIDYGRKWIDIAKTIGSPSIRQHVRGGTRSPQSVDLAADSLGRLAEYGATRNIIVNLENDSPVSEDPYFLVSVIEKVNSPFLRALPDFGNSLVGHDHGYNQKAVKAMFRHAYGMAHVKNAVRARDGKEYSVDLKKMFAIAKESSYRGYFSMEFDTGSGDPFEGTTHLVEESLKYLK